MEIRTLIYFLEIAKVHNISKAAENLHMSQPPLSRQMQQLEEELGVQLLIRGKRKVTLTPEGYFLKERAQQMVQMMDKTVEQIGIMENKVTGKLYIGSIESISVGIMPKWIQQFHEKYPEVLFDWWSGNSNDVLERLERGLVDVAVVRTPCDNGKFHSMPLIKEPWAIYFNKDCKGLEREAENKEGTIPLSSLKGIPLIIPSTKVRASEIKDWFHEKAIEPQIICEISPAMNAISLVEENMGAAILPESVMHGIKGKGLIVKRVVDPIMESEIIVAYNRNARLSLPAEKFIEYIEQNR